MSNQRLIKKEFTADGTWKCPAGIRYVFVTGCGGGGGGGGGGAVNARAIDIIQYSKYYARGGGGGQSSPTITQVMSVIPGLIYNVFIGAGGFGGANGEVWVNTSPSVVVPNAKGGVCPGEAGGSGASSIFGSTIFTGGLGGTRGNIFVYPIGGAVSNASPPVDPLNTVATLLPDELAMLGLIDVPSLSTFPKSSGLSRADGLGGGAGGGGGVSNNIYSIGGVGGNGAGNIAIPGLGASTIGANGSCGGGGGGGGGGEGLILGIGARNGSPGGNGGNGYLEVSWIG